MLGMGMSQEQAAAAIHAAKMAQLNAFGHNFDKLPPGLLPPHLDLTKLSSHNSNNNSPDLGRIQSTGSVTIEPANSKVPTSFANLVNEKNTADIRRDDPQPMDLGSDNIQSSNMNETRSSRRNSDGNMGKSGNGNNGGNGGGGSGGNSSAEEEYGSDDDGERDRENS